MNIEYRNMNPEEAKETMALARRVFPFWYSLFIWGFKDAVVAVDDGKIVGGAAWHIIKTKVGTFGYLDFGFTDKDYRGMGIGRETYTRVMNHLKEAGCDSYGALVLSDNTASWTLLADNGCSRSSGGCLRRKYGFFGALKIQFETAFVFAPGGELWKTGEEAKAMQSSAVSIIIFLLANCALALLTGFRQGRGLDLFDAGTVAALLSFRLLVTRLFIGRSETPLRFSFWRSGWMLPVFVLISGGVFPLGGDFYPAERKWSYADFRRKAGMGGLGSWLSVLLAAVFLLYVKYNLPDLLLLFDGIYQWIYMLLIFNAVPIVCESWPGNRVLSWNKGLFIGLAAFSVLILVLIFL
ncbi:MAG: GNAT family N-acetyltransferase [Spirochaetales bacterium]|nr:GNAT family N-acetyltransferase [Spirochaetales bacterium]